MNKNSLRVVIVLAIILVVFSVISFVAPFTMNGVFWLAWIFGVAAIALQLYVLQIAFKDAESVRSKVYGFPIARIGIIYMLAQLILSLVAMALANICPTWVAAVLFIVLLGAAAIGFIGADATRDEVERQEVKLTADTSTMKRLRSMTVGLVEICNTPEQKQQLQDLADAFRESDPVTGDATRAMEAELLGLVGELKGVISAGGDVSELVSKVTTLLSERNRECKAGKRK